MLGDVWCARTDELRCERCGVTRGIRRCGNTSHTPSTVNSDNRASSEKFSWCAAPHCSLPRAFYTNPPLQPCRPR